MSKFFVLSSFMTGQVFGSDTVDSPDKMEPVPKAGEEEAHEGEKAKDQNKEAKNEDQNKGAKEEFEDGGAFMAHAATADSDYSDSDATDPEQQGGQESEGKTSPGDTNVPPEALPAPATGESVADEHEEKPADASGKDATVRQASISLCDDRGRRDDHELKGNNNNRRRSKSVGLSLTMEAVQEHVTRQVNDMRKENAQLHKTVEELAHKVEVMEIQKKIPGYKPAAQEVTNLIKQFVHDIYDDEDKEADQKVTIKDVNYQKVADFVVNFIGMPGLNKPDDTGKYTEMEAFRDASAQYTEEQLNDLFAQMKEIRNGDDSARFLSDSMLRTLVAAMPQKMNEIVEKEEESQGKAYNYLAEKLGQQKKGEKSGPEQSSLGGDGLRPAVN